MKNTTVLTIKKSLCLCIVLTLVCSVLFPLTVADALSSATIRLVGEETVLEWDAVVGCDEYILEVNGEEVLHTPTNHAVITSIVAVGGKYTFDVFTADRVKIATASHTSIITMQKATLLSSENEMLSWSNVPYCQEYVVSINGIEFHTTTNRFDLSSVLYLTGDYDITIQPIAVNAYYVQPESLNFVFEHTATVVCELPYSIHLYMGECYVSWQPIENAQYMCLILDEDGANTLSNTHKTNESFVRLAAFFDGVQGITYTVKVVALKNQIYYEIVNAKFRLTEEGVDFYG